MAMLVMMRFWDAMKHFGGSCLVVVWSDILQGHHQGIGDQSGSLSPESLLLQLATCIPEEHGYPKQRIGSEEEFIGEPSFPVWFVGVQTSDHGFHDKINDRKLPMASQLSKIAPGVRCWYCPWHDFWYLGFQGKNQSEGHPFLQNQQKIGSWGFPQIRFFFSLPVIWNSTFFLKKASLAGIFFFNS